MFGEGHARAATGFLIETANHSQDEIALLAELAHVNHDRFALKVPSRAGIDEYVGRSRLETVQAILELPPPRGQFGRPAHCTMIPVRQPDGVGTIETENDRRFQPIHLAADRSHQRLGVRKSSIRKP